MLKKYREIFDRIEEKIKKELELYEQEKKEKRKLELIEYDRKRKQSKFFKRKAR